MTEFDELPPLQKAKRYRQLAGDARLEASTAIGSLRESYLLTAEKWDQMAADLEGDVMWDDKRSK